MAKVSYTARVEVSDTEVINLMTMEYSAVPGYCWTAVHIATQRQADGTVLHGPVGERVESFPRNFETPEEALREGVNQLMAGIV